MQPEKPQPNQPPSCLTATAVLGGCFTLFMACFGSPEAGLFFAVVVFVFVAMGRAVVLFFAGPRKPRVKPVKKAPKPPAAPSPAELAKEAKAKYERTLAWLERSGLEGTDLKYAKLKAKQTYLKEINGLMA